MHAYSVAIITLIIAYLVKSDAFVAGAVSWKKVTDLCQLNLVPIILCGEHR
jgi:hypothetical protein